MNPTHFHIVVSRLTNKLDFDNFVLHTFLKLLQTNFNSKSLENLCCIVACFLSLITGVMKIIEMRIETIQNDILSDMHFLCL